ncbi:tail protein (tape measure) [Salmonella enterica subsp. arizonae serovar 48:z4,z24:-]|uniref:Tail protein (Tape measure) n=1 Tax=Salmonella enterica subsp. arizonae serovar 48:z4,z24:- TaxID=1967584 RepID=A0A738XH26_SALER|nr:tail protein (tape measure) [Salmonella enterica]EFT7070812.1 tail protein (tape measure) [Salmonella enterica subsp. arizonae serovar 48:z4,z24:-]EHE2962915.1 tail protein (tape measure) [Salmonella enterica subsp. arizonae serovar 48:z4,z24:-]HAE9263027.1 tail protein (tape measure) [Salmonella enterica subsp. arizonae serovar 48:z4,z24:-]
MTQNVGDIEYVIKANTDAVLKGNKQVDKYLSQLQSSFDGADKAADNLGGTLKQAGSAIDDTSSAAGGMAKNVAAVEGAIGKLNTNINSLTRAILESRSGVSGASSEFSRAESIIESLGNQLAILEEQQEGGARSAAVLAAQLRAGSNATEAEKKTIADLTGRLYDMKNGTEAGAKGTKNWKSTMQQAGYQVNDFIVQVQGGQSALVAFSQQGSQLAGAFGPGGAVIGAVIALGSVMAGTLITSLNGGKNAMDALKDATEALDKVISVSSQGVAAFSDKYAALARVNADVATLLRNQALLEYNQAISKIPKAISDASDSFITLGDRALAAVGGASPSIKKFNDELSALGVTTNDWSQAIQQANSHGQYASGIVNSLSSTVSTLSSRLGISKQAAFDLARELSDLSNNPSPEALQGLAKKLQEMKSSSKDGQSAIVDLAGKLVDLAREAANAKINVDSLNKSTDNLTTGQKNLIKQSERNLALSKLQGEARARLQAQYAAEDAGFAKDDPHTKQMEDDAAATYRNTQAQKDLQSQQKKGASQAESIAQKLERLKQQSDLAADSTKELSREQAVLAAQQSLGKGATQEQIALAGKYRGEIWDTANALKAQAAAEKLLPEARENASYKQDVQDLKTALDAKKISQQQYNQTSEVLEQQHQANLAKIRSQKAVSPMQSTMAEVDPVQRLANQHAQQLALIQQFEQQGVIAHDNALALKNAADTEYEQARIAAQWEIFRNQSQANELLASSLEGLQSGATNALTGLISGTQSLQEAFANIGTTILNSVVGSLVQMGIEWVKSQLMGQAAAAASLASTMAQATAAASAWAPAAMSASIATYGSAAAVGQAAYAESLLAAKGMALAGGRRYGGTVSAGNAYRINEDGRSEIFQTAGGQQAFIPNQSGKIIPADKAGGGGGVVQHITFEINTTGGIDDATMAKMAQMMKQVSLNTIRDQQRPNGLLRR